MANYPNHWPRPDENTRKNSLILRITEQDKERLFNRDITTRALAVKLGVREAYLSHIFPGKTETGAKGKPLLIAARREFRLIQAKLALEKSITIKQAASICNLSYRSMARAVQHLKEANES